MSMEKYNVLLLGGGGREHALAWKMSQSTRLRELYIAPGNAGTESLGTNVPVSDFRYETISKIVIDHQINMVIVGPEAPLVDGLSDDFKDSGLHKDLIFVGPSKEGAQLEGSKAYAKEFMFANNIPTAQYRRFDESQMEEGLEYLAKHALPVVLKADGLAAGKGVVICEDTMQAQQELREMLGGKFGTASHQVVVEEFLRGLEFSVFVVTDGREYQILPVAKDYKRIGEGDTGPNTGGMGSVSPVSFVDQPMMEKVVDRIIEPTIRGLSQKNIDYHGFIFFGLIEVEGEPYVIEYNCRLGDPETQVVLPRFDADLLELFEAMHHGSISKINPSIHPEYATAVILASGGYPGNYDKGKIVTFGSDQEEIRVFHAGTTVNSSDEVITAGGRVLAACGTGPDLKASLEMSYRIAKSIEFDGKYYRKDIGFDIE